MSETKKILQRCEIAQADKWAIEDLYATDEAWSADLEKLKVMTQQLAAYAGHLADSRPSSWLIWSRRRLWGFCLRIWPITVCGKQMRTPGIPSIRPCRVST